MINIINDDIEPREQSREVLEMARVVLTEAFRAPIDGVPNSEDLLDEAFRLRNLSVELDSTNF